MPVKRKPDQSIVEALNKAQHIAFGPVLFQAVRSALAQDFCRTFPKQKTPKRKPPAPAA